MSAGASAAGAGSAGMGLPFGWRKPKRTIRGLLWAELAKPRQQPFRQKPMALSPQQRHGIWFERRVADTFRAQGYKLLANPWIEFEDVNGVGWASPDIIITGSITGGAGANGAVPSLVVVECKLTRCAEAEAELTGLYGPLVELVFGRRPRLLGCCRNWSGSAQPLATSAAPPEATPALAPAVASAVASVVASVVEPAAWEGAGRPLPSGGGAEAVQWMMLP